MHVLPQFNLDGFPLPHNAHVGGPQFTKKVQRGARLLPQGELEGIGLAPLFQGLLHVPGHAVKAVRRTEAVDPLVGPLVVVIADPVVEALPGVGKRGEDGILEEFGPNRLPETLDLA